MWLLLAAISFRPLAESLVPLLRAVQPIAHSLLTDFLSFAVIIHQSGIFLSLAICSPVMA